MENSSETVPTCITRGRGSGIFLGMPTLGSYIRVNVSRMWLEYMKRVYGLRSRLSSDVIQRDVLHTVRDLYRFDRVRQGPTWNCGAWQRAFQLLLICSSMSGDKLSIPAILDSESIVSFHMLVKTRAVCRFSAKYNIDISQMVGFNTVNSRSLITIVGVFGTLPVLLSPQEQIFVHRANGIEDHRSKFVISIENHLIDDRELWPPR